MINRQLQSCSRTRWFAAILLLGIATVLAHLPFYTRALSFLTSDSAIFPLLTTEMLQGRWNSFCFQQPYGGTIFTLLRTGWSLVWQALTGPSSARVLEAQFLFTYIISSLLVTGAALALVKSYCSTRAALIVSGLVALGMHAIIVQLGIDFYIAHLLFGFVLLGWRARFDDPWRALSKRNLFLAGVVSGLAIYTSRASLPFVAAFFLAPQALNSKNYSFKPRWLSALILLFVTSFFMLWIFGEDIPLGSGRVVKIHAHPQLRIATALFLLLQLPHLYRRWFVQVWDKLCAAALGFLVGFGPELVFWAKRRQLPPSGAGGPYEFHEVTALVRKLPGMLQYLVDAGGDFSQGLSPRFGFWSLPATLLLILSLACLIKRGLRERRFHPILVSGILSLMLFCLVPGTTRTGPPRYIFPFVPTLLVALGCFGDEAFRFKKQRILALSGAALLICGFVINQYTARWEYLRSPARDQDVQFFKDIIETFRNTGVEAVLSDNYVYGNQFSLVAIQNPHFVPSDREYGPQPGFAAAARATKAGILLVNSSNLELARQGLPVKLLGQVWSLRLLKTVPPVSLYLGTLAQ